jgi:hypothetical protein
MNFNIQNQNQIVTTNSDNTVFEDTFDTDTFNHVLNMDEVLHEARHIFKRIRKSIRRHTAECKGIRPKNTQCIMCNEKPRNRFLYHGSYYYVCDKKCQDIWWSIMKESNNDDDDDHVDDYDHDHDHDHDTTSQYVFIG